MEMSPIRVAWSANGLMTRHAAVGIQGQEARERSTEGEAVLTDWDTEICFPSLTCCLYSDRESVIHRLMVSSTFSRESSSSSRARMTLLKSTNRILA